MLRSPPLPPFSILSNIQTIPTPYQGLVFSTPDAKLVVTALKKFVSAEILLLNSLIAKKEEFIKLEVFERIKAILVILKSFVKVSPLPSLSPRFF